MKLHNYITEQTNTIELYFCPDEIDKQVPFFQCSWKEPPNLPFKQFKARDDQEIVEYAHRGLIYQYDVATDNQKTIQRTWLQDEIHNKHYIVSLQEETLPIHRFPSTQEINNKTHFHRISYKWTNRIQLIMDIEENEYTVYMKYQHVDNIDLEKMNEDWNALLQLLRI